MQDSFLYRTDKLVESFDAWLREIIPNPLAVEGIKIFLAGALLAGFLSLVAMVLV